MQCCSVGYDVDATIDKMERLIKLAVERDQSQLVVFPEALYVPPDLDRADIQSRGLSQRPHVWMYDR